MNEELKTMKQHAETFDLVYVRGTKNNSLNIFCGSETLIKDYLLLKSITTSDLQTLIILSPWEVKLLKKDLDNRLSNADLDQYCKNYSRKESIEFNNGSKIDIVDYNDFDTKLRGLRFELIYIANSALDKVFHEDNGFVYTVLADPGRLIYNFDSLIN